jgi:hypothetical protein
MLLQAHTASKTGHRAFADDFLRDAVRHAGAMMGYRETTASTIASPNAHVRFTRSSKLDVIECVAPGWVNRDFVIPESLTDTVPRPCFYSAA